MTIRRIPVRNAMSNEPELLEGEVIDVLPNDQSVYVDRAGKTYDPSKGVRMGDLPQAGVVQLPRTTWFARTSKARTADLVIVGYLRGAEGCLPIYERRNHAHTPNDHSRLDDLGSGATPAGRRNRRARKAARAAGALELSDAERSSRNRTE